MEVSHLLRLLEIQETQLAPIVIAMCREHFRLISLLIIARKVNTDLLVLDQINNNNSSNNKIRKLIN